MGVNDKIFTEGSITKTLLKFAIPAMISLLVVELYNMVDTIYVGRYIGSNAIGALTIAFPIQRFMTSVAMLISVGTSTFVAKSLGEKNYTGITKTIINSLLITLVSLSLLSLLIFAFHKPIITMLGASNSLYPLAQDYISIILVGAVFQGLTIVIGYIMTSLGNTRINLYANSLGAVLNIFINHILISFLGFGVKGAAIATITSQFIAFIFICYKFLKTKKALELKFTPSNIYINFSYGLIKEIFIVGFSTFVIEISDALVSVILNNLLVTTAGDSAIIMIGVITKISMFMFVTIIGISSSMQPIVSYNFGANNKVRMLKSLKIAIKWVTIFSLSIWGILMIFTPSIIGFFLKETELLKDTVMAFRICISLLPLVGVYYIGIYYYQSIEKARRSFILSIYRQIVIFIPLAVFLIGHFGLMGAWIAYPLSDLISAITSIYFMRKTITEKVKEPKLSLKSKLA